MKLYHGSNQWALLHSTLMMLEEKQKAYVKDSLTRAIREMKVAKIEGRKLQSVDDFINEM